jgi:hypothetical protein
MWEHSGEREREREREKGQTQRFFRSELRINRLTYSKSSKNVSVAGE